MKKILFVLVSTAFIFCAMTSCSSSTNENSPRGVLEKSMECRMDNDKEGWLRLTDMPEEKKQKTLEEIKRFTSMQKEPEDQIKSYEIVEENVDDENGSASYVLNVIYEKKGETKEFLRLQKNQNGQWLIH